MPGYRRALPIAIGFEDAKVNHPILRRLWIHIPGIDHIDAFNQAMDIATVLTVHKVNGMRVVFIQNQVIKHNTSIG